MEAPPLPPESTDQPKPKNEPFALVSLIASIVGTCLFFPAILGVICGHLARVRIRRSEGRLDGDALALAGMILGYCVIAMYAFSLVLVIPALNRGQVRASQEQELSRLRQLSIAFYIYTSQNHDQLPSDLSLMMETGVVTDGTLFVSPGTDTPPPQTAQDIRDGQTDFIYYPRREPLTELEDLSSRAVLIHSHPDNFKDWVGIGFLDSHVESVTGLTIEEAARLKGWDLPGRADQVP